MSSESDEEKEEIRHFSHNHGLSLMTLSERRTDAVQCKLCNKDCDEGRIYVCKKRKCSWFALHQSCAMGVQVLLQELYNPLHPHPLALQYPKPGKHFFYCNACGCRHQLSSAAHSKIFRCDKCDFNLDDQCAYIRPAIEESRHRHHQYHQHPLLLLEKIPIDRIYCRLCATYISDPTSYGCLPCGFFLHRSCFERNLPQQIQHFYHPCPLILYTHPDDYSSPCRACDQFWPKKACLYYGCSRCRFVMDIDCALLPTKYTQSEQQIVFHFLHGHPLMSLAHEIKADHHDQVIIINKCYLCGKGCTDSTHAYACFYPSCKNKAVYIHKSCLEFPQQICHPFHPYHPLTLKPRENIIRCNACRELIRDENSYVCEFSNCSFGLHIECSRVIRPPINFEGHDHLLHFRDNVSTEDCSACNLPCESYGFSCPYCDFNLHLTCGPLPSSINHKCHVDPLILTNSPVEDNEDCEPEEFYCDACEEQRDPLLPFYYCAECRFVAEVKCVISKVASLLKGEHGDVELRNPFGQFGNLISEKQEQLEINPAPLTLHHIFLFSLRGAEKKELNIARLWARGRERRTSNDWEYQEIIFKGDEAYTQFMKFVDIGIEIPIELRDTKEDAQISNFKFCYRLRPEEVVVNIGDYKITRKLAPILNGLLSKYGDVSAQSNLSLRAKVYFFHMLCDCIYSMINTKVVDITKKDLLNWWASLETSKLAGFRIKFAFDHLKRVVLAHFGPYFEKQGSKALDKLDRDIKALKVKLEHVASVRSSLIKVCSKEASALKQWKAGVGLL